LEELGKLSKKLKSQGKTVIHCHGTFDLMHPGHIKYFEEAKSMGDVLCVTITTDVFARKGIGRPVFREELRADSIAALSCVDFVALVPYETAHEAIHSINPSIYVKGSDYEGKEQEAGHPTAEEKKLVESLGGHLSFTHDPVTFSSTAVINDHFSTLPESIRQFLNTIRADFTDDDVEKAFDAMRGLRVLVIGDAILDVYHYSHFLGRSVKEEIPRVKIMGTDMFLGGSLAVANTLAGFCDSVGVVAMLGRQNAEKEERHQQFIRDHLHKNVRPEFLYRDDAPTVVNERYVNNEPLLVDKKTKVNMRKYFGLYHINEVPVAEKLEAQWAKRIKRFAAGYDVIIVTDYGLGMLTEKLIHTIARLPQFLAVNTQTNSMNYGFNLITKYPRADYVSISQPEMRLALHDKHSTPEQLAEKIAKVVHVKTVAVTLGALGVMIKGRSGITAIPALSTSVVDNIGAGDAFLALSSLGIQLRLPPALSGFIGAVASALSCGIIANKQTVDRAILTKTIQALLKSASLQPKKKAAVRLPQKKRALSRSARKK